MPVAQPHIIVDNTMGAAFIGSIVAARKVLCLWSITRINVWTMFLACTEYLAFRRGSTSVVIPVICGISSYWLPLCGFSIAFIKP
ncbi:hypothetical protein GYMLUDRAFT_70729 [Collybiopsis luxurians FD-317 M1]|nr:hypothetical protein GYMLUDRAFT_70729 [Collybiopsis luxurians FD-317 M1]